MTSKKIIAFMLIFCMLLSCVSAFAATVESDAEDVVFPEEGINIIVSRRLWEAARGSWLFVLSPSNNSTFPFRLTGDHYKGVELSFEATLSGAYTGAPETFTVDGAYVYYTRASGDGELCLGLYTDDIISASPELTAFAEANPDISAEELFPSTASFTPSNVVMKKGNWKPASVSIDTGAFPEGTVFLSYQEFFKYPSTFYTETRSVTGHTYSNLLFRNTRPNSGPYQFFVPETTGTYNVYVQLVTNNGYLSDRGVRITVNGEVLEYLPQNYEAAGKLPSGMEPLWCYETNNKTVTLTKDELVAVELIGNAYGRPTAIAFVPADKNADLYTAITANPQARQVAPTDVPRVAIEAYHPDFAKGQFLVTVNGESVAVTAGRAAKQSSYSLTGGHIAYGLPVRILPDTNTFPTYATVLDAIAKYMYDKGNETPIQATSVSNGAIAGLTIFVNDKIATDIDWYEIKEGDAITFKSKDANDAFDPTPVIGVTGIDDGNMGLFKAIGGYSAGSPAGSVMKFCFEKNNTVAALGSFAANFDETGLQGCYIVGYATLRKDNTNLFGGYTNLDVNSKLYFENIEILGYDGNYAANQASRIDVVTGKGVDINSADPRYKDLNDETLTNAEGKYYVKPYAYFADPYLYKWTNVYIVNKGTDIGVQAVKGNGAYTLKTGGMHVVDIVIATYSEDGKTVTDTTVMKEQILMFNNPITIPLEANQKAFVWKTYVYRGTTMVPVIAPLSGADL